MAEYNGNNAFFEIDGINLSAYFTEIEVSPTVESIDTTAGAGRTHRRRKVGLKDGSLSGILIYDDAAIAQILAAVKAGSHYCKYGPEGQVSGKPRHEGRYIFEEAPHKVTVVKELVVFTISGVLEDTPLFDMYEGAVWP